MQVIDGGVNAAKGFMASGAEAGIKYKNRKDMALVYTKSPAVCAGTFTKNVVKAAPVLWDIDIVRQEEAVHAVVLNSGIANACTGGEGRKINERMAEKTAKALGVGTKQVCTASTGVIGMQMNMDAVEAGIQQLAKGLSDSREAAAAAASAIMTTDTVCKEAAVTLEISGKKVTVGGMAKGSGMIHPDMATMLSVVTTDAVIGAGLLKKITTAVVAESFNMISVDRDTSTNDTFLVLANGEAENDEIMEGTKECEDFMEALTYVAVTLAKKMAADGEGATKLFETKVTGAGTKEDAVILAKSVITSNLVKTAVYGSDANWGRILCALGYSGVEFDPEKVDITITSAAGTLQLVENGKAADYSEELATGILSESSVTVVCDMKLGECEAVAWGCDLTYDYVKINGDYRS
ncbi:MAG: bifunctional glutamate N-acetyltransferase/amino-acid acetyltransferase ArgJ [Lachnospiraceae bacterium]|nr:bifunctional glutamate N-acetyltransferase/amino-acid acetyltransferase ArgJ [Lachnospiraceae bacterium]